MKLVIKHLFFGLLCFSLSSCEQDKEISDKNSNTLFPVGKEVNVNLQINPSLESDEEPLSRSSATEQQGVYAVNVFWKGKGLTSYQPYASGLFSDISNINIGLIEGYFYRFDCSFLGENELPYDNSENDTIFYGMPFSRSSKGLIDGYITNKLIISISPLSTNNSFHQSIYKGTVQLSADKISIRPTRKRFFGSSIIDFQTVDYSKLSLSIKLNRAYYSLQFKTDELHKGDSIRIESQDISPFYLLHATSGKSESEARILSMSNVANIYTGSITQSEILPLSIYYRPALKEEWYPIIQNQGITIQRNKNNVIRIVNIDQYISNTEVSFENDMTQQEEEQTLGKL